MRRLFSWATFTCFALWLCFVNGQHPCSVPPSWEGNYQLFTNGAGKVPVTEGNSIYNALYGLRFDGNFGRAQYVFYNLPSAFYLVNNTVSPATCIKLPCGSNCFKPMTIGGDQWRFNATVVVGITKVEKWSVFSQSGKETVVIDQPTQKSSFKQCLPITNNNVAGNEENNLEFTFGLWYSVVERNVGAAEFVPPAICPSRALRDLPDMHASFVSHFMDLNALYR